jgi:hypothetical protein
MWNLKPEERLREWLSFRKKISSLDLDTAIAETVRLWSFAPYVTHYLAADLFDEWPDPWTLVHENMYCDLAKSLGMFYTLYLSDHYQRTITDLELGIYKNTLTHDVVNTVWVNGGKYILNLEFNTIVNKTSIDKTFVQRHRYTVENLKLNLH